jgi:ribosomal protein S10
MFINVHLVSKNKNSLKKFLKVFKNLSKNKKLQLTRTLSFFQKIKSHKVFTILKSPHVNKTAQEQLEFSLFSKNVKINSFQILKILILLKKIQNTFFSDIDIKIKFILNLKYKKNVLINKFNLYSIKFSQKFKVNFKQMKLYFLILNFYGKFKF